MSRTRQRPKPRGVTGVCPRGTSQGSVTEATPRRAAVGVCLTRAHRHFPSPCHAPSLRPLCRDRVSRALSIIITIYV